MAARLPNFFLAGVPKSGTTSLYSYLAQHPLIFVSPLKEPHFFADEVRLAGMGAVENWEDYRRLFAGASSETAIGEGSVCYLWSPTAVRNIMERIPGSRFLVVLRNPIDRAFSQYVQMLSRTDEPVSFLDSVNRSLRSTSRQFTYLYPFLELGLYGEQLNRLFRLAPRAAVRICLYEDYRRDPVSMMRGIFEFLGVDSRFTPDFSERHMVAHVPRSHATRRWLRRSGLWDLGRRFCPKPLRTRVKQTIYHPAGSLVAEPEACALLADYYRADLGKLSALLGHDFTPWLTGGQPVARLAHTA